MLCKSVLGSLGNYLFSLYKAPEKVLNKLEGIRRKFFWGEVNGVKKINWIAWKKVLTKKVNGGLGIGSLKALNLALLGKWWWRFYRETDGLWRSVITSLYGNNGNLGGTYKPGCWGCISRLNNHLELGSIDFKHLFFKDGDIWEWGLEDDGIYSVASLRQVIDDIILSRNDHPTIAWKYGPTKAHILLWRAYLGKLPTRMNLIKRNIAIPSLMCPVCNLVDETERHLFLECRLVLEVRNSLDVWFKGIEGNEDNIFELATKIDDEKGSSRPILEIIFLAFFYSIWGYRNELIHLGKAKCAKELVALIKNVSYNWYRSRVKNALYLDWDLWYVNPKNACNTLSTL